jgi:hypothetical protein
MNLVKIRISGFPGDLTLALPLPDHALSLLDDGWLDQTEISDLDRTLGGQTLGHLTTSRLLFEVLHQKRIGPSYVGKDDTESFNLKALKILAAEADKLVQLPHEVPSYRWGGIDWYVKALTLKDAKANFNAAISKICKDPNLARTDKVRLCNLQLLFILRHYSAKDASAGSVMMLMETGFAFLTPEQIAKFDQLGRVGSLRHLAFAQSVAAIRSPKLQLPL